MKILKKVLGSKIGKIGIAVSTALTSVSAFATANGETVEGMRIHFVNTSNNAMAGIQLVAAVVGVAYLGFGLFSLKAASDSAGQSNQNTQKGIVKVILGGCLISIPFLLSVSNSVLQSGALDSGISIPTGAQSQSMKGMNAT